MGSNCKNCGAPVSGPYCEYCGTPTYTPADAAWKAHGKRMHCWYEDDGNKVCFDVFVKQVDVDNCYEALYGFDAGPVHSMLTRTDVAISAEMLDFDREAWADHFREWRNNG